MSPYTIAVDTGGTFTDLVLADGDQILGLFKSPTTPDDLFDGIVGALDLAASAQDLNRRDLLERTAVFVYSTTRSTNAIIEGDVAKTAFMTTRGNRDLLLYREGGKDQPHNLSIPYPSPYVPRRLTFEITERVLSDGSVAVPLDESEVREAARRLEELEVEAVGICLLWSVVNPAHELRIAELLSDLLPNVELSLSHQVNRIVREYRRASSTVIDASIKPLMRHHLGMIDARLREHGFRGDPLMVTHVSGGVLRLDQMAEQPLHTVDSGPALAPIAGVQYAGGEVEVTQPDLLIVDTGGTSFDVSLAQSGTVLYTREKWLGRRWYGHMTGLPAVDTKSFGAGGGSIAHVDAGGLLHVGPESAGAEPGPACYGRGGTAPTLTDAALVLGYVDPENFLGGRLVLDLERARAAVQNDVGTPLGLSCEEAAEAIVTLASESMRGFITEMTIAQGRDPRRCAMVAGGGAAGLNIVRVARDLGINHVAIPKLAAGLSAIGGQFSDLMASFSRGHYTTSREFDYEGVAATLQSLNSDIDRFFAEVDHSGERSRRFLCEARYDQQIWEIDVDFDGAGGFRGPEDVDRLRERFDDVHLNLFAVNQPGAPIEIITWRAEGRIARPKPSLFMESAPPGASEGEATPSATRSVFFDGDATMTGVYRSEDLPVGARVEGPAIIEAPTTTVVISNGSTALVRGTHYLVAIDETSGGGAGATSRTEDASLVSGEGRA